MTVCWPGHVYQVPERYWPLPGDAQRPDTAWAEVPCRVDLTPDERSEVGRLLVLSWERSGRAVGAKVLAMAVENYGATVTDLLAVTGDPVRDLQAARESTRRNAAAERERAAAALRDV